MHPTRREHTVKYEHGTHAAYVLDRCRCEPCRAANRDYERERAHRIEPAYISAGPARAHIADLAEAGVGLKQIAKASGLSQGTLWKLVYGVRGRGPSRRIRKATHDKIIAVTPRDRADGARVPAGPVLALVDEMVAAGVPRVRIAEAIGQTGPGLQLGDESITVRHARTITAMHTDWKAGRITVTRGSRWGQHPVTAPVQVQIRREPVDISDLILQLAEIVELRNSQPWRSQAACRNRPSYLWFPARGDHETMRKAQAVCGACTVRSQCRAEMLPEPVGVYGGLPASTRRQIIRQDTA